MAVITLEIITVVVKDMCHLFHRQRPANMVTNHQLHHQNHQLHHHLLQQKKEVKMFLLAGPLVNYFYTIV